MMQIGTQQLNKTQATTIWDPHSKNKQTDEGSCAPILFASRYLNVQEKKYSTNELELLASVWTVDRYKHYLLGNEYTIATDHKALTSALDGN